MRPSATVVAAFVLAFSAAPLAAQAPSPIDPDRGPSLSLRAVGSGLVGVWFAAGDRTDLGFETGFSLNRREAGLGTQSVSLGMSLRRFLPQDDETALVPYLQAGILTDYTWHRIPPVSAGIQNRSALGVRGHVGLGAEWFVAPRLSIGGHVGIQAGYTRERLQQVGDPPPPATSSSVYNANTITSGIQLRLFLW